MHATSLPVGKARTFSSKPKAKKLKSARVEGYGVDDTPKAFARLMAFSQGTKPKRSGLDDGIVKSKKQRKQEQQKTAESTEQDNGGKSESQQKPEKAELRIQPGESMADFKARVDQALPLSGVSKSGRKVAGVSDHRVTKHERKLKRLQKGWREEEARIRDKEQEERELAEEEEDEQKAMWEDKTSELPTTTTVNGKKKKAKKGKRKLLAGEVDNHSEDEWEALKKKRETRKGLHDVVSAPPEFTRTPREIFKVKNGAGAKVGNVPNAAGSLRKREELGEERKTIIDTYREMMAAKRNA
jgi:antitoxin (DNA-binding transcriptional repressor) of toxin-antitoxin stability system